MQNKPSTKSYLIYRSFDGSIVTEQKIESIENQANPLREIPG